MRVEEERDSDNDKRELADPPRDDGWLTALAKKFKYKGSSKHKKNPHPYDLPTYSGKRRTDATYCDAHAKFPPERMDDLPELFQAGIEAGLTGANYTAYDEPTIVWCIDKNGWIYEGRITTASQALYHGFPVRNGEAIALDVIKRYSDYVRQIKPQNGMGGKPTKAGDKLRIAEEKLKNAEEMYT